MNDLWLEEPGIYTRVDKKGRKHWYVRFEQGGRTAKRALKATTLREARQERACLIASVAEERYVEPDRLKVTISTLLDAVLVHWQTAGPQGGPIAALASARCQLERVRKDVGSRQARGWTYSDAVGYVAKGETPAQKSTRGNRMAILRTAMKLGKRDGRLDVVPDFPKRLDNVRQGFLTPEAFEALIVKMPRPVDAEILRFCYYSAQRICRVLELHVSDVDPTEWTIRGEAARGHKDRPMIPLVGAARAVVEARLRAAVGPGWHLFHEDGQPITYDAIHGRWLRLMRKLGLPYHIHDLRRSAARNLVNAGVDPLIAAKITGHRSLSMFDRYAIRPDEAVKRAAQRLDDYLHEKTDHNPTTDATAQLSSAWDEPTS